METVTVSKHVSELSTTWAYMAMISLSAFLVLLILLHVLKTDLDPTWHMVSEYAIGRYGWMMQVAFVCLAFSCISIAIAGWPQVMTTGGKIGMVLLVIAAIGLTIAAFNNTDPANTLKVDMSPHGKMHGFGFMIGVPSLTIAAVLINLSLRNNPGWEWAKQSLFWSGQLPWISVVAMVTTLLIFLPKNDGKFGPTVVVGLPNRLWVLACCVCLAIIAFGVIKLKKEQVRTTGIQI